MIERLLKILVSIENNIYDIVEKTFKNIGEY